MDFFCERISTDARSAKRIEAARSERRGERAAPQQDEVACLSLLGDVLDRSDA
jgi:hypothetical protein